MIMKLWVARDKYGLWLLETNPYIDNDMFTCDGSVYRIDNDLFHKCLNEDTTEEEYDTYEEAAIAGIEYTLDNLI